MEILWWFLASCLLFGPISVVVAWRFVHRSGQTPEQAYRSIWLYLWLVVLGPIGLGLVLWVRSLYREPQVPA